MNNPRNIFSLSVLIMVCFTLSIFIKFGVQIWGNVVLPKNINELNINYPNKIKSLENKILINERIISDYEQTSAFQHTLMRNISEFKNKHNISIYSIPKVHIYNTPNIKSTTIQVQIIGNLKNQLQLLQNFEKNLNHIPLKSCLYQIEKKRKKKKLIGKYIFQYKSSNSI